MFSENGYLKTHNLKINGMLLPSPPVFITDFHVQQQGIGLRKMFFMVMFPHPIIKAHQYKKDNGA